MRCGQWHGNHYADNWSQQWRSMEEIVKQSRHFQARSNNERRTTYAVQEIKEPKKEYELFFAN